MRFSSIFQLPLPRPRAVQAPQPMDEEARSALLPGAGPRQQAVLPEALDERVRLVGEWQLGEG